MSNIFGIILLCTGFLFNLSGCLGLIRLPDVYSRLQSAAKCLTLGTCSILLSLLFFFGFTETGIKVLIAVPLLFFSATVSAHALIRGAYIFGVNLDKRSIKDDYKEQAEKVE